MRLTLVHKVRLLIVPLEILLYSNFCSHAGVLCKICQIKISFSLLTFLDAEWKQSNQPCLTAICTLLSIPKVVIIGMVMFPVVL